MRSIPAAMTWELFSRGRWSLPAAALGATALPVFILAAMSLDGKIDPRDESMLMMHAVMTQMNAALFGVAIYVAQGPMSRLYAYPVRTSTLVAWRLLPGMAAIAGEVLVSTALLNSLFDVGWPLGGPVLFVAVAFAAAMAATWLTEKSAWAVFALAVVGMVLGMWFNARYGLAFSSSFSLWTNVTPLELWTMLGIAALAYGVGVVAVGRNRRGEPPFSIGFVDWWTRVFDAAPDRRAAFRSPAAAQFWFEWQRKGWAMPAVVIFGLAVGVSGWYFTSRVPQDLVDGFVGGGGMLTLVGFLAGLILGNVGPSDGDSAMGHFRATRPLTTSSMAKTILYVAAGSVVVAWVVWAAAFFVAYWLLGTGDAASDVKLPKGVDGGYFAATLLGPWIVVGCITSVVLAGRSKLFLQVLCGIAVGIVVLSAVARQVLPQDALVRFQTAVVAGAGLALVLGTAWVFVEARRRSLIHRPTFYGAAMAWVAGTAVVVWMTGGMPLTVYFLPAGILALTVVPLAAAPLALTYNRNR